MEKDNLTVNELVLIGVGGILGAGFFLASGLAIHTAGPIVLLDYAVSAFIMSEVFCALTEMIVANPVDGSFRVYAEEALGDIGGFLSGWIYWTAGVFIMSSEVTASAIFTRFWFPRVPLWIFALLYSLMVLGINALGTKNFGTVESWFSTIKISALFIITIVGILTLMGLFGRTKEIGLHNYFSHGGIAPNGIKGFFGALLMSLIPFGGVEVTAMTASKTKKPQKYVPIARKYIVLFLTVLYLLSIGVLLGVIPWYKVSTKVSPFIKLLSFTKIPYIDSIMNFVILTAALTTMNGAMYGVSQVMYSLGKGRFAPTFLSKLTKRDVPIYALLFSSIGLLIAVILSYILPKDVYEYITSATGFVQFFNWIIILYTFIRYRPMLKKKNPSYFECQKSGFPIRPWLTIVLISIVLLSTLIVPKQAIGLLGGVLLLCIILVLFFIANKFDLFDKW
ncbi:amino acid permease [Thermoanaerobacterium sp. RBIITD]|uniref:amino acid permease n=1 Tax=Thermoanaerobacterium sp. RBIITD TaxID=1550240 RepID=UPI000BB97572|nr:amino acid permease [Thermoanaerobacterium sp. RBIITD]SNX55120.1 L-asparagine transporter [Thermoanaerobacterium sp. RBIITD]